MNTEAFQNMKIGDIILWLPPGTDVNREHVGIVMEIQEGFPESFLLVEWTRQSWGICTNWVRLRDCILITQER